MTHVVIWHHILGLGVLLAGLVPTKVGRRKKEVKERKMSVKKAQAALEVGDVQDKILTNTHALMYSSLYSALHPLHPLEHDSIKHLTCYTDKYVCKH